MAFKAIQLTLTASTATACIVVGSGAAQFPNGLNGAAYDPIPVSIKNEDAAATVWWGGSNVDSTHGQSIPPGGSVPMNLYGPNEVPYVWSTGTPIVSVLLGRQ
jgi:hypothetical protein